jgi:hypothetical protein
MESAGYRIAMLEFYSRSDHLFAHDTGERRAHAPRPGFVRMMDDVGTHERRGLRGLACAGTVIATATR